MNNVNIFSSLKRFLCFALAIYLMAWMIAPQATALSPDQRRLFDSGINYFDAEALIACQPGVSTAGSESGSASLNLGAIAAKYKLHSATIKELGGPVIDSYKAEEVPPAVSSVLKIIIADVFLSENPSLTKEVTVKNSQLYEPGSSSDMSAGQRISLEQILNKTLADSSNTGANILMDEAGGRGNVTNKAHKLGYSDKTNVRNYYSASSPSGNARNETTVADLTKAMDKIFTQSSDSYKKAQSALRSSKVKWGLNSQANKWGGTSLVTGNSALFENINGKSYIITMYIGQNWEQDREAKNASGPIAIKNSTNEILASLQSGSGQALASGSTLCCGSGSLVGSENAERIFNFFVGKGLTPIQAAGIVGNIKHESGFEPQRLQSTPIEQKTPAESLSQAQLEDGKLGWGIVQFTPPGKFINNVNPKNQANDLGAQLEFVWNQLIGKSPAAEHPQIIKDIRSATTTREAVLAFQGDTQVGGKYIGYERPQDQSGSVDSRNEAAIDALNRYGSGAGGTTPASSTCGTNSRGEVIGEYSLPVDKKWYVSDKVWFTKPHHDYAAADIPVPLNTPIYSVSAGKVISAPVGGGCGNGVLVDAGNSVQFLYCHGMDGGSVIGAKNGDVVTAGQMIMRAGYTGRVEPPGPPGTHLHLEIIVGGKNVCPQSLLVGIAENKIPDVKSLKSTGCIN